MNQQNGRAAIEDIERLSAIEVKRLNRREYGRHFSYDRAAALLLAKIQRLELENESLHKENEDIRAAIQRIEDGLDALMKSQGDSQDVKANKTGQVSGKPNTRKRVSKRPTT